VPYVGVDVREEGNVFRSIGVAGTGIGVTTVGRPTDWNLIGLPKDPTPGDLDVLLEWQHFFRQRQHDAQDALDQLSKVVDHLPSLDLEGGWFLALWGRINFLKDQLSPEVIAHRVAADAIKSFRRVLRDCQADADKALSDARAALEAQHGTGHLLHSAKGTAELAGSDLGTEATQLVRALEDSCEALVNILFDNIHHTNDDAAAPPEPSFAARYFRQVVTDLYGLAGVTANTLDGATEVGKDVETMMMLGGPGGGMSAGGAWAVAGSRSAYGELAGAYASGVNPYKDYGLGPDSLDSHWLKKNWKDYDQKWGRKGSRPPKVRQFDPAVEETLGGHTIEKHVGKTNKGLRDRLKNEEKIPAASTYESFTEAETYMNKVAKARKPEIEKWLKSGKDKTKEFTFEFPGEKIGRRLTQAEREKGTEPHPSNKATIVIKRDPSAPDGYIVITSFPGPAS